jgi:hypothetical protein
MKLLSKYIILLLMTLLSGPIISQTINDPPISPILTFVSVNPTTREAEMTWSLSPSEEEVEWYEINYYFYDPGCIHGCDSTGSPIATIYDPTATHYSAYRPYTSYFSESYLW